MLLNSCECGSPPTTLIIKQLVADGKVIHSINFQVNEYKL